MDIVLCPVFDSGIKFFGELYGFRIIGWRSVYRFYVTLVFGLIRE